MNSWIGVWVVVALGFGSLAASPGGAADDARAAAKVLVARVLRADYEGDRAALQRLRDELNPFVASDDARLASRVRYWQGFALWRRAINGFNGKADPKDLGRDAERCLSDFEDARRRDPAFIDATVGVIGCLQTQTFLSGQNQERVKALVGRFIPLMKESLAASPENPRLLWLQGGSQWWAPPNLPQEQVVERQTTAMATYERGLQFARKQKGAERDGLEPSWGEPELLMSLAWANLNRATPDVRAAEDYAMQALALVPYWQYLRDTLMPQIRSAKAK